YQHLYKSTPIHMVGSTETRQHRFIMMPVPAILRNANTRLSGQFGINQLHRIHSTPFNPCLAEEVTRCFYVDALNATCIAVTDHLHRVGILPDIVRWIVDFSMGLTRYQGIH